jgi:RimJ/RimL family protein N-acetyltransferase
MKIAPIETKRLLLREFTASDFEAVHSYGSDPVVVEFMEWGPNTEDETHKFIEKELKHQKKKDRKVFELAVTLKETGALIGGTGITLENGIGTFGYCFDKNYWGNGYATEAAQGLIAWAKQELEIQHFRATCDVKNTGSRRVLEKLGLKIVQRIDKDKEVRGKWRDTYVLELT